MRRPAGLALAPGVPDGAGLLLSVLFTRRCPSWRPA